METALVNRLAIKVALVIWLLPFSPDTAAAADVRSPSVELGATLDRLEGRRAAPPSRISPRTGDLLDRQDRKIADQKLRALETRSPRNQNIPILRRQLDRVNRPIDARQR